MEDSAARVLEHQATSDEVLRGKSTWETAHTGRLSKLQANSHTEHCTANTVDGAVDDFSSQLPAVYRRYRGFHPTALILQPSAIQAGVVTLNVTALYLVSRSTGNCLSCWDFHRSGENLSTVQLFGQYLTPATFMLGLNLALVAAGVMLLALSRLGVSLVRGLPRGGLTVISISLAAGILEFKALTSLSPVPREGSSLADPLTLHVLMLNFVVLIISLMVGAYFTRTASDNLTSVLQELPDYSVHPN